MKEQPLSIIAPLCSKPAAFAGFETLDDPELEKMLAQSAQFLREVIAGGPPRWLSFIGKCGTGKTFLANLLFGEVKRVPKMMQSRTLINPVKQFYWPRLLSRLRDQEYWLLSELAECNFLFLDELSLEHYPSGFAGDRLCELLSVRVGRWTMITSNLTMEQIGQIYTRIPSRMIRNRSVVVQVNTVDFNLRAKAAL